MASKIFRSNTILGTLNIQCTIWYDKDRRTYWLSSSPVEVEERENGIIITTYSAYSGFKQDLLTVPRASAKNEKLAIDTLTNKMPEYLQWYQTKYPAQTAVN